MNLANEISQQGRTFKGAAVDLSLPDPNSSGLGSLEIPTRSGLARIYQSVQQIDPALRRTAFADQCRDFRYYEILENTLRDQFDYRYLVLENHQTGERSVQPFFFVDQDLTAGLPERPRAWIGKLRTFFPRLLNLKMLMVGCAAGEGQLHLTTPWAIEALHEAVETFARQNNVSLILLKDFPAAHRQALVPFSSNSYQRVPSLPGAKLHLDFANFEEFMQKRLSRVFRKNLRRKFRQASAYPPLEMSVCTDVSPFIQEVYPLYRQTLSRAKLSFEELTPEFFCQIGREMPDRVRFFIWRQQGKAVAFSFCMVHNGVLQDLDLGLEYSVALKLHLYFITLRDVIQWAIDNQIRTYYTTQLNYDPKYHLRLELAPLDLYACHTSALINPIFRKALHYLQPARHDPILQKFPNANELL